MIWGLWCQVPGGIRARAKEILGRPFKVALDQKETFGKIRLFLELVLCSALPSTLTVSDTTYSLHFLYLLHSQPCQLACH